MSTKTHPEKRTERDHPQGQAHPDPLEAGDLPEDYLEAIETLNEQIQAAYQQLLELLGGTEILGIDALRSERDLYRLVETRLPTAAIDAMLAAERLLRDEVHHLIIPERTLMRRRQRDEPLSEHESEVTVRVGRIQALAEQVFANKEKAAKWLRRKSRVLGERPLIMAAHNEYGAHLVEQELSHIAHGDAA